MTSNRIRWTRNYRWNCPRLLLLNCPLNSGYQSRMIFTKSNGTRTNLQSTFFLFGIVFMLIYNYKLLLVKLTTFLMEIVGYDLLLYWIFINGATYRTVVYGSKVQNSSLRKYRKFLIWEQCLGFLRGWDVA